jgi:hypothetical protein
MFFIIDNDLKIIFGWSAKCGCSHLKKIVYFLITNNINSIIHTSADMCKLPIDIENYTTILIIRNPYVRLVSGFLNKYNTFGVFRNRWKYEKIVFFKFVDELLNNNWNMIDRHHFTPQTTEDFNEHIISRSKILKIYDLNNIDYIYIQELYNKEIPDTLLKFRGGHERKLSSKTFRDYVYNMDMMEYYNYNVHINQFYNTELQNKVYNFYINDFIYFEKNGFIYQL